MLSHKNKKKKKRVKNSTKFQSVIDLTQTSKTSTICSFTNLNILIITQIELITNHNQFTKHIDSIPDEINRTGSMEFQLNERIHRSSQTNILSLWPTEITIIVLPILGWKTGKQSKGGISSRFEGMTFCRSNFHAEAQNYKTEDCVWVDCSTRCFADVLLMDEQRKDLEGGTQRKNDLTAISGNEAAGKRKMVGPMV